MSKEWHKHSFSRQFLGQLVGLFHVIGATMLRQKQHAYILKGRLQKYLRYVFFLHFQSQRTVESFLIPELSLLNGSA